jgi:hypothetical protein
VGMGSASGLGDAATAGQANLVAVRCSADMRLPLPLPLLVVVRLLLPSAAAAAAAAAPAAAACGCCGAGNLLCWRLCVRVVWGAGRA